MEQKRPDQDNTGSAGMARGYGSVNEQDQGGDVFGTEGYAIERGDVAAARRVTSETSSSIEAESGDDQDGPARPEEDTDSPTR